MHDSSTRRTRCTSQSSTTRSSANLLSKVRVRVKGEFKKGVRKRVKISQSSTTRSSANLLSKVRVKGNVKKKELKKG